jgi:hypothetical protein
MNSNDLQNEERARALLRAPISRRELLRRTAAGAAGLALAPRLAPAAVTPRVRAKSVIQIWMWGGPAHIDTFDPKPDAGRDYCGPLDKPIATNVKGMRIGQMLPNLAKQADKYSILRSMTHGINGHETASYMVQTGRKPGGNDVHPCVGSVVSRFKGYDAGYKGVVPPYIVLTSPQGRFSEAGFMGSRYKPFATGGDPNRTPFAVEGIVAPGITKERQRKRRELMHKLDTLGLAMKGNPQFAALDKSEEDAYNLILGEASEIFDLSTETDAVREAYGQNTFGQSCLMARRLVELGVPYITINYKGWDTHKKHFESMRQKLPQMDMGMATLLQDLSDRGLLDSTIVWWGGEFGRTPKISWDPPWNGGRSHYGKCFSSVIAGGGFRGGQVVGASDKKGETVADRPVYPWDMIGSIYDRLGIPANATLPHPQGKTVHVVEQASEDRKSGGLLKEIMV